MNTRLRIGYQIKLLAVATLLSTGVTSVMQSYIPEQEIKQILRKVKRLRMRRLECDPEEDEREGMD